MTARMSPDATRAYDELVSLAFGAMPADIPVPLRKMMNTTARRFFTRAERDQRFDGAEELVEATMVWAAMGWQHPVRLACEAFMLLNANSSMIESHRGDQRAPLAWAALYVNLTGYAQLFNLNNSPSFPLSHNARYIPLDPTTHEASQYVGTPDSPGHMWKPDLAPLAIESNAEALANITQMRLAPTQNDLGWSRGQFDSLLQAMATHLRRHLGGPAELPALPVDPAVVIPYGFTGFYEHFKENHPATPLPGLPPITVIGAPLPATLQATGNPTPPAHYTPIDPALLPRPEGTPPPTPYRIGPDTPSRQPLKPLRPNASIKTIWARIETLLNTDADTLLNPGASRAELKTLETHLGHKLPTELRDSLKRHNGMSEEHELLPGLRLLSTEEIAEEWDTNTEAYEDTNHDVLASPHPETATNFTPGTTQLGIWNTAWIPLTTDGLGNNLTTDLDPGPHGTPGQILTINHDQPHTGPSHPNLAGLLTTWANNLND